MAGIRIAALALIGASSLVGGTCALAAGSGFSTGSGGGLHGGGFGRGLAGGFHRGGGHGLHGRGHGNGGHGNAGYFDGYGLGWDDAGYDDGDDTDDHAQRRDSDYFASDSRPRTMVWGNGVAYLYDRAYPYDHYTRGRSELRPVEPAEYAYEGPRCETVSGWDRKAGRDVPIRVCRR